MALNIPLNINPYTAVDYSQAFIRQIDPYWQEKAMGGPIGVLFNQLMQLRQLKEQQARQRLEDYLKLASVYPEIKPSPSVQQSWEYLLGRPTWLGLGRGVGAPPMPETIIPPEERALKIQLKYYPEIARTEAQAKLNALMGTLERLPEIKKRLQEKGISLDEEILLSSLGLYPKATFWDIQKGLMQAEKIKENLLNTLRNEIGLSDTQMLNSPYFKVKFKQYLKTVLPPHVRREIMELLPELSEIPDNITTEELKNLTLQYLKNYYIRLGEKEYERKAREDLKRYFPETEVEVKIPKSKKTYDPNDPLGIRGL